MKTTLTTTITIKSTELGKNDSGEDECARAVLGEELAIWTNSPDDEYEYALSWDAAVSLHEFLSECIEAHQNTPEETENTERECDHPSTTLYAFNPPRCAPWHYSSDYIAEKASLAWATGYVLFIEKDEVGSFLSQRGKSTVGKPYPLVYTENPYARDFLRHALYLDGQTMFFYVQTEEKCS